jgi:DNA-binding transcriptional LysR family regulator
MLDTLVAEARGAEADTVAGPLRVAAFRSAAAHLLPAALERVVAAHPNLTPQVRIVRDVGRGVAGEVADGHVDLAITTVPPTSPVPAGLLAHALFEERYYLAHPAGHPDPRGLPLVDWAENCSSYTRRWWTEQDWLPRATVTAEDDSVVLSMVAQGFGMAVMPQLTLIGAPPSVAVADLGPRPPTRHVGFVTSPAMARTRAVQVLIRELRAVAARGLPTPPLTATPTRAAS